MTRRQQRFLVAVGIVFGLLLVIIASENVFVMRFATWGLIIFVTFLSFSKENWIRPDKALQISKFARYWLITSVIVQMVLAVQSLRGAIDLSGFILDQPGMLFLVAFLPMYGAVLVSVMERFKELG